MDISYPFILPPEDPEEAARLEKLATDFVQWAEEQSIKTYPEVQTIMMLVMASMRRVLKLEELDSYLHMMMHNVEFQLQHSELQRRADGVEVPVVLAEDWRDKPDGLEMVKEIMFGQTPETVPADWAADNDAS